MLDVLVRASPAQSDEAVLETLDEALAAQIIEEVTPGLYQFTHALVRVAFLQRASHRPAPPPASRGWGSDRKPAPTRSASCPR